MADLLIRNVPPQLVTRLKRRAKRHGRSVQAELLAIVEAGSQVTGDEFAAALARLHTVGKLELDVKAALKALREERAR